MGVSNNEYLYFINLLRIKTNFPERRLCMIGIVALFILSWIALQIFGKQSLSVLGLLPTKKRTKQFIFAFLFTGMLCALVQSIDFLITHQYWKLNPTYSFMNFLTVFWWNIKSVLFEEFIFRGALLYIIMQKIGEKKGAAFSAICFGIYHWFSYGLFGNFIPMILIFLATGFTGLVWAYAFQKTKSMLLPIGLHLGWNFTLNQIFSKGPLGNQLFIPVKGFDYVQLVGIPSLFHFLLPNIAVPLFTYLFIKFYICKTQTKSIASTQK